MVWSWARRSPQSVEPHTLAICDRTPALQDIFEVSDSLLGTASTYCTIFLTERFHSRHRYIKLKQVDVLIKAKCLHVMITYDVSGSHLHFQASHKNVSFHCTKVHRCIIVPLQYHSSKSNIGCRRFRVRRFHTTTDSVPFELVCLKNLKNVI